MDWQKEFKKNICTIDQISNILKMNKKEKVILQKVIDIHPMSVTRYYLSLINTKDKKDPIRKLIIPAKEELDTSGDYDTSGESQNTKQPGLQHKYKQTALILSTNQCAAYCRFCFRKRLVGLESKEILSRFDEAIDYIKKNKEINNVLISGGDSFILPTAILKQFLEKLVDIKHLDFIRFASRVPVVFPQRIYQDKELLDLLKKSTLKKRIYFVTHFNHPSEITVQSKKAISQLIESNIIINNQTVLMKGVNDKPQIISSLMNELVKIGVNPYYIFQCRPVKRVKNYFQIPIHRGIAIIEEAKKKMNGHSKRFKYIMSHQTGKIEILGNINDETYFKYHQAKKNSDIGKMFKKKIDNKTAWLDKI